MANLITLVIRRYRAISVWLVVLLTGLYSGSAQSTASSSLKTSSQIRAVKVAAAISALTTEALIDKLQDEAKQGAGTHTTAFVNEFLPLDVPARFGGGVMGSAAPNKSEVMVELVRRGVRSVPALLDHLSDTRPTKLVIGGPDGFAFDATWFSDEYDYRFPTASRQPKGVNTVDIMKPARTFTTYTIKVGDLCFVALGQITNRRLLAARYQPSGCMVINSPTQYPALAKAAREDWHELTAETLEQSLLEDLIDKSAFSRGDGALQHLMFYFPIRGQEAVERLLDREVLDLNSIYQFAFDDLAKATNEERQSLVAEFKQRQGTKYWHGLFVILNEHRTGEDPQAKGERDLAATLLHDYFNEDKERKVESVGVVDFYTQKELIDALSAFQWDGLNAKLLRVFRSVAVETPVRVGGRIERADLALSCSKRLIHQGYDKEFSTFFSMVIEQLKRDDAEAISIQKKGLLGPGNAGYHTALNQRFAMYGEFLRELNSAEPALSEPRKN